MMREYLDSIQFSIADSNQARGAFAFHSNFGCAMHLNFAGSLQFRTDGEERQISIKSDTSGELRVQLDGLDDDLSEDVRRHLSPLQIMDRLPNWVEAVERLPEGARVSISLTYEKAHSPVAAHYQVFTTAGLRSVVHDFVDRIHPESNRFEVVIETPLVDKKYVGRGVIVVPLGSGKTIGGVATEFIVPSIPGGELQAFLRDLQVGYVCVVLLGGHRSDREQPISIDAVRQLSDWLTSHELRRKLARGFVGSTEFKESSGSIDANFLRTLMLIEDDLLRDSLSEVRKAKATFKSISVELIRDFHRMRSEILTLVGNELFQTSVTIAVAIGGLSLAPNVPFSAVIGVTWFLAALFLIGSIVKVRNYGNEFHRLLSFSTQFQKFPIAKTIPEFRDWYSDTIRNSYRDFYAVVCVGMVFVAVPLMAVSSVILVGYFSPSVKWTFLVFMLMAGLGIATSTIYWYKGPWRNHLSNL